MLYTRHEELSITQPCLNNSLVYAVTLVLSIRRWGCMSCPLVPN